MVEIPEPASEREPVSDGINDSEKDREVGEELRGLLR